MMVAFDAHTLIAWGVGAHAVEAQSRAGLAMSRAKCREKRWNLDVQPCDCECGTRIEPGRTRLARRQAGDTTVHTIDCEGPTPALPAKHILQAAFGNAAGGKR